MRPSKFNNSESNESFPIIEGLADYFGDEEPLMTSLPKQQQQVMQQHYDYQSPTTQRQSASAIAIQNHDYHDSRMSQQSQPIQHQSHPTVAGHIVTRTISGTPNFHPQLINRANVSSPYQLKSNIQMKHVNMVGGQLQKLPQQRRIVTSRLGFFISGFFTLVYIWTLLLYRPMILFVYKRSI